MTFKYLIMFFLIVITVAALLACAPPAPTTPSPSPSQSPSPSPSPTPTPTPTSTPTPTTPSPAPANQVSETVSFPGQAGPISAYEAKLAAGGPFPALIVIHENRGLTEHIKDVTRRFAGQGYVALGVDLLSRIGGKDKYPTDQEGVAAIGTLDVNGVQQDLQSAFDYLKSLSYVNRTASG